VFGSTPASHPCVAQFRSVRSPLDSARAAPVLRRDARRFAYPPATVSETMYGIPGSSARGGDRTSAPGGSSPKTTGGRIRPSFDLMLQTVIPDDPPRTSSSMTSHAGSQRMVGSSPAETEMATSPRQAEVDVGRLQPASSNTAGTSHMRLTHHPRVQRIDLFTTDAMDKREVSNLWGHSKELEILFDRVVRAINEPISIHADRDSGDSNVVTKIPGEDGAATVSKVRVRRRIVRARHLVETILTAPEGRAVRQMAPQRQPVVLPILSTMSLTIGFAVPITRNRGFCGSTSREPLSFRVRTI
jgi:hypothetical protein